MGFPQLVVEVEARVLMKGTTSSKSSNQRTNKFHRAIPRCQTSVERLDDLEFPALGGLGQVLRRLHQEGAHKILRSAARPIRFSESWVCRRLAYSCKNHLAYWNGLCHAVFVQCSQGSAIAGLHEAARKSKSRFPAAINGRPLASRFK